MHTRLLAILVLAAGALAGCSGHRHHEATTAATTSTTSSLDALRNADPAAAPKPMEIDDYLSGLGSEPLQVGFDIDDTALFSSYGFRWALDADDLKLPSGNTIRQELALPQNAGKDFFKLPVDGDWQPQKTLFWGLLNSELDRYSVPKQSVARLIAFHQQRHDRIIFITSRAEIFKGPRFVEERLAQCFNLPQPATVRFTNGGEKDSEIRSNALNIYYGDSDGDMRGARKVSGVLAVRILRSRYSSNVASYKPETAAADVLLKHTED